MSISMATLLTTATNVAIYIHMTTTTKCSRAIESITVDLRMKFRHRREFSACRGTKARTAATARTLARAEREDLRNLCCALRALRIVAGVA